MTRIERSLATALGLARGPEAPPSLLAAMRYAVFPGGARIRPRLCIAVARACGDESAALPGAAAAAIELLHCASLVHDDLPCFDDAATRRGRPSVHKAFGEPIAVLTGDALIALSFQALAHAAAAVPARLVPLVGIVARSIGAPHGIIAGQAWECEAAHRSCRLSTGQNGLAVRGRNRCRGLRGRTRCGRVVRARRAHWGGLPDRRRHPRCRFQRARIGQAGRPGSGIGPPECSASVGNRVGGRALGAVGAVRDRYDSPLPRSRGFALPYPG